MPSELIAIADAVVTELNNHSFAQAFTAVRRYRPQFTLKELKTLRVAVAPRSRTTTAPERGSYIERDHEIDIGVMAKLDAPETDADAYMDLVQEIETYMRLTALSQETDAVWQESVMRVPYDPDRFDEERAFLCVLTLTYRTVA
jgi:hypothetical protein